MALDEPGINPAVWLRHPSPQLHPHPQPPSLLIAQRRSFSTPSSTSPPTQHPQTSTCKFQLHITPTLSAHPSRSRPPSLLPQPPLASSTLHQPHCHSGQGKHLSDRLELIAGDIQYSHNRRLNLPILHLPGNRSPVAFPPFPSRRCPPPDDPSRWECAKKSVNS